MLVSGILTSTIFTAAVAPNYILNMIFGETVSGSVNEIIVRNWGALVGIVGLMLIYGAYNESVRKLILIVAISSKIFFIGLVLTLGLGYLSKAGTSIVVDALVIILFVIYLIGEKGNQNTA